MKYVLVSAQKCPKNNYDFILGVEHQPSWLERLFGARARVAEYRGRSSVWYELPKMERQPTFIESMLGDMAEWWTYHHNRCPWRLGE